jgi:hypothetical protein
MNAFYEHHRDSIRFGYRCFDRILLIGLIQPFQQPESKSRRIRRAGPLAPRHSGRPDPFKGAKPDQVVVFLKAREPAHIVTAIGDSSTAGVFRSQTAGSCNTTFMSTTSAGAGLRCMCPCHPFSARVCLYRHHWMANRMREEGVDFQQCSNAFSQTREARAPPRTRRHLNCRGCIDLRPQMVDPLHPVVAGLLHAKVSEWIEASSVNCARLQAVGAGHVWPAGIILGIALGCADIIHRRRRPQCDAGRSGPALIPRDPAHGAVLSR